MDDKRMRLDKFLAELGKGSRSQVREMVKRGRVQVNGATVTRADAVIDPDHDAVACDGARLAYAENEYYMMNKPRGVVSATKDDLHETVMDLVRKHPPKRQGGGRQDDHGNGRTGRKDLFPVGRLDIDAEGLLVITNDGELAHRLLSPKRHVDKRYLVRAKGTLPDDAPARLREGLTLLDGTKVLPAELEYAEGGRGEAILTIREGKFHQVKRMFEALGCRVAFLKRLSMGSLNLDDSLEPGEYRPLLAEEVEGLRACGRKERERT